MRKYMEWAYLSGSYTQSSHLNGSNNDNEDDEEDNNNVFNNRAWKLCKWVPLSFLRFLL